MTLLGSNKWLALYAEDAIFFMLIAKKNPLNFCFPLYLEEMSFCLLWSVVKQHNKKASNSCVHNILWLAQQAQAAENNKLYAHCVGYHLILLEGKGKQAKFPSSLPSVCSFVLLLVVVHYNFSQELWNNSKQRANNLKITTVKFCLQFYCGEWCKQCQDYSNV